MPRTPHKGVQILRFPMGLVQVFFRPNPENFRLFFGRRTPAASVPMRAVRRGQHHVHGVILQSGAGTHRPPIVLALNLGGVRYAWLSPPMLALLGCALVCAAQVSSY